MAGREFLGVSAPRFELARLRRLTLALAVGAIGGAAFYLGGLPLPWMLGAMSLATTHSPAPSASSTASG